MINLKSVMDINDDGTCHFHNERGIEVAFDIHLVDVDGLIPIAPIPTGLKHTGRATILPRNVITDAHGNKVIASTNEMYELPGISKNSLESITDYYMGSQSMPDYVKVSFGKGLLYNGDGSINFLIPELLYKFKVKNNYTIGFPNEPALLTADSLIEILKLIPTSNYSVAVNDKKTETLQLSGCITISHAPSKNDEGVDYIIERFEPDFTKR